MDLLELGLQLRRAREARGLTQQDVAAELVRLAWDNRRQRVGVSPNMVSKWERGQKRPSALYQQMLPLVLHTLPLDLGFMMRWTPEHHLDDQEQDAVDRRMFFRGTAALGASMVIADPLKAARSKGSECLVLTTAIRRAMLSTPGTARAVTGPSTTRRVRVAWRLRQEGQYEALASMLPDLILDARAAARSARTQDEHAAAAAALTHAYNATSSALKVLGNTALAFIAADRALEAATSVEAPTLIAAAAYRLANVFLSAGQFTEAGDVALQAADRLGPFLRNSVVDLATSGSLTLTAATAAAQNNDMSTAWQLLGEATAASRTLDHDHADLHTIFGPTGVAMASVQLAVEHGDGRGALRRAEAVSVDDLPRSLLERRAHHLMNVARGHALVHDDAAAIASLLEAEKRAPGDVRRSQVSRTVVTIALERERRGSVPGLRELADRLGIAA